MQASFTYLRFINEHTYGKAAAFPFGETAALSVSYKVTGFFWYLCTHLSGYPLP
ncbi:hypothetical protein ABH892_001683 [Paenibacillus sp. RC254]